MKSRLEAHIKGKWVPLRTAKEMAAEFELTSGQSLGGIMRQSPVKPPKPKLVSRAHVRYYDPSEMRRWWTTHRQAKAAQQELAA